jgi:hypothetical protein
MVEKSGEFILFFQILANLGQFCLFFLVEPFFYSFYFFATWKKFAPKNAMT